MGRYRVHYSDYLSLGQRFGLELLTNTVPESPEDPALWRCQITKQIFSRAYHQIVRREFASPGQRFRQEYKDKFELIATQLGVSFDPDPLFPYPASVRYPARWVGANGRIYWATYLEMGYGRVTHEALTLLGINGEPIEGLPRSSFIFETQELIKLADIKKLHVFDMPHNQVDDRILFECQITGEIFTASYNYVLFEDHPNGGQQYWHENEEEYYQLAQKLDVYLLEERLKFKPANDSQPTAWRGKDQANIVYANFKEMSGKIRPALRRRLGMV